jgi:Tfp pilus assembly protein PilE
MPEAGHFALDQTGLKRQTARKGGAQSLWPTSGERIWQQDCRPEAPRCSGHRPAATGDEESLIPACHQIGSAVSPYKNAADARGLITSRVITAFPPRRRQRLQRVTDRRNGRRGIFSKGGFTLIDLMLTLFLFAIVTAIAIPSFRGYIDNTRLKGAARQIMSDINDVQLRAKSENAQYRITLNADPANTYALERVTAPAQTQTKTLAEHGSDIRITATTFTANSVNFQTRGILNEAGIISLSNSRNSTATIDTSLAGRTNVKFALQ